MVKVKFPDGKSKEFQKGITPADIAKDLGPRLHDAAIAAKINGELVDLSHPINSDCSIQILTFADEAGKEIYRHSCAHLLAHAVKQLFPHAKLAIGAPVEDGFYYDFDVPQPFTPEDLEKLEKRMEELAEKGMIVEREEMRKAEAKSLCLKGGEKYKLEIIEELPGDAVTFYRQGDFGDLCRGPHLPNTKKARAFKLTEVAGAYWRGDSKNPMLQRIYGVAFWEKKELKDYLARMEEAKKRDHRRLGKELGIYMMHEVSPGAPIFLPKGAIIYNALLEFMRSEYRKRGYQEVITPLLYEKSLWETSGHWEHFQDKMFLLKIEERDFSLKPMNCPSHLLIYKSATRSYRDLPLRIADFAPLHRNEPTGTLTGLTRVRKMSQDDAHIFVAPEQMKAELLELLEFTRYLYADVFKFEYSVELSTRPAKAMGDAKLWEQAEAALADALKAKGIAYKLNPGEGAFYGPKIDVHITDAIGRKWQCATIQLDFQMPGRFGAAYEGADGKKHAPIMIHRALLGSLERFMGVLIEHYAGAFPLWLSPVQIAILPVSEHYFDFARKLGGKLSAQGLRVFVDDSSNTTNYKIREAQVQKIPYMLVVGQKEEGGAKLTVRTRKGDLFEAGTDEFVARMMKEIEEKK